MQIVKSPGVYATIKSLKLIPVAAKNEETIIKKTLKPHMFNGTPNQFTTVIPLKNKAKKRTTDDLDFSGVVQPIVFEFDEDPLSHQQERTKYISKEIGTVAHEIYSGGKSYHFVLWFKHFASNPEEYNRKWMKLYFYLSEEYSEFFHYCNRPKDKLEKSDPERFYEIDWALVPDIAMSSPNRYFRQANGLRKENNKGQTLTTLNPHDQYDILSLEDFIGDVKLPEDREPEKKVATQNNNTTLDNFEIVKRQVDLKKFIEKVTGKKFMRNNKMNPCPICTHNDCFHVTPEKNLWNCFSGSHNSGGTVVDFVKEFKELEPAEALRWIASKEEIELAPPEKQQVKHIASQCFEDAFIDICYDPQKKPPLFFSVYDGNKINNVNTYENDDIKYLPTNDKYDMIGNGVVLLPSKAEHYTSEPQLVRDITSFIHKYVGISPLFEKISAYYVLLSWVFDKFNVLPYLRVKGDYGSGKTTFLKVVGSICYRPIFSGGSTTPAPLFRLIEKFQGTFILDEADFNDSHLYNSIIKILNCGYQTGLPVLRIETEGRDMEPRAFKVFGPKVIATRKEWQDEALESRCLTEVMDGKYRSDLKDIDGEFSIETLKLRNKLLNFRFRKYDSVKIDYSLKDRSIEPRLNQIITPILSIVDDEKLKSDIKSFTRKYNENIIDQRGLTLTAFIVETLDNIYNKKKGSKNGNQHPKKITIKEITDYVNNNIDEALLDEHDIKITPQKVGRIIKKDLGLSTKKDRKGMYLTNIGNTLPYLKKKYGISKR